MLGACQDKFAVRDARWQVNPSNGFLSACLPYTWVGVRLYHNVLDRKAVRVLHRPEQVQAPSFRRGLRQLPVTPGHPQVSGVDVDVQAGVNAEKFIVGATGDEVLLETVPVIDTVSGPRVIGEAKVPTGRIVVWHQQSIDKMTDANDPHTQTSLGYTPLWATPPQDEITGDVDGFPVGTWESPWGPLEYDIEHVLDREDPRVLELVEETDFDPAAMGANHMAAVMRVGTGRGDIASELLRLVDCRDAAGNRTHFFPTTFSKPKELPVSEQAITKIRVETGVLAPATDAKLQEILKKRGAPMLFVRKTLDVDSEAVAEALQEMSAKLASIASMLVQVEGEKEAVEGERDAANETAEKAQEAVVMAEEKVADAQSKLASAETELAPLRAAALDEVKKAAPALLGLEANADGSFTLPKTITDAADVTAAKQAVVLARHVELTGRSAEYLAGRFDGLRPVSDSSAAPAPTPPLAGANDGDPLGLPGTNLHVPKVPKQTPQAQALTDALDFANN